MAWDEPHAEMPVRCDMDGILDSVSFPDATPLVMNLSRTFWKRQPLPTSIARKEESEASAMRATGTT